MAEADAELAERVARWCAEAGRQTGAAQIRRALAALGWDDLLAVRALLADAPPARPLGPFALVDIARGTPPDLAAEREREGRYRPEEEAASRADEAAPSPPRAPRRKAATRGRRPREIVIHRARDRTPDPVPTAPEPPRVADLRRPEGRAVLERLIRRHGARRAALARALAAGGWRRDDGAAPGEEDVVALLDHHGLARAFERRERDELLHAVRAAGGVRATAAERLALDVAGLEAALERLGASAAAERIREGRRVELRLRGTLAERIHLLLRDEARLRDLGVLDEFEADLAARLPEHVRALRLGAAPLAEAFARSLSLEPAVAGRIAVRFGLDLGEARAQGARGAAPGAPARRPRKPGGHTAKQGRSRPERRGRGRPAERPQGRRRGPGKR
jgi:hypothetical protein